jgi:hypothetical protein
MAEALGVAAGVIAVVQISGQIVKYCYDYFKTAKNAKEDILKVINVVGGLQSTLEMLQRLLKEHGKDPEYPYLRNLKSLTNAFDACEQGMRKLSTSLGIEVKTNVDPKGVKVTFKKKAKWPFEKKEIAEILKVIDSHRENFSLAITGDNLQVALTMSETVTRIQTMVLDQKDEKVVAWLDSGHASYNHDLARKKHEPTTGNWFIESKIFVSWTKATNASLWLHGIPGAGKTILCSTVIEHVINLCNSAHPDGYAYFYFDFNDKRTAVDMLRSIIAQLCTREGSLPPELHKLYQQCDNGRRQPGQASLIEILSSVLTNTHRTFIILDALDECSADSDRDDLFKILKEMISISSKHLNILVTSRPEKDITEELEPLKFTAINLKEQGDVKSDIDLHVRKCLEDDKRLRTWDPDTKQKIQEALVRGACGM